MTQLVAWHLKYLFSKKTRVLYIAILISNLLVFLYLAKGQETALERVLFLSISEQNYVIESIQIMKLCLMILMTYVALQLWLLSDYDIVLLQRVSRQYLYFSKWLSALIVVGLYATVCLLYFYVFGYSNGFLMVNLPFGLLVVLFIVYIVYYTSLMAVVSLCFKSVLAIFIVFLGSTVASMFVDYGVATESMPLTILLLNSIFINIHVVENLQISMIIASRTVVFMCALLLSIGQYTHSTQDF